jgi:hypothetical protein
LSAPSYHPTPATPAATTVAANAEAPQPSPTKTETTTPAAEGHAAPEIAPTSESPRVAAAGEPATPTPGRPAGSGSAEMTGPPANPEPSGSASVAKSATTGASTKASGAAPAPRAPSGSSGLAEKADGVLLRYNPEKREWERLTAATPLIRPDRLLCLNPFRVPITLGKVRMTLVGETEVRILSLSSDAVPALELVQGRLLIRQPAPGPLRVMFSNRSITLDLAADDSLALERAEGRPYGQPITRTPPLAIYCIQGDLAFTIDQKRESLKSSSIAVVDSAGQIKRSAPDSLPRWLTQPEPSPYLLQVRDQFLRLFHPGRPVLLDVVVATEDERPEIKDLAISALKALGDLSYLMPLLRKEGDPVARRSAIAAIRAYLALGPEAVARVREQLDAEFGQDLGTLAQHMLIGFTPEEASSRDTYPRLVGLLAAEREPVGIRELALDTLKRLTGRDDLGYDPDHPGGKGLEAWNDLLRRNELKPLAPRAKGR